MMVDVRHPSTSEVGTEGHHLQLSMFRASLGSMRAISGQRLNWHWSGVVGGFFRALLPVLCSEEESTLAVFISPILSYPQTSICP